MRIQLNLLADNTCRFYTLNEDGTRVKVDWADPTKIDMKKVQAQFSKLGVEVTEDELKNCEVGQHPIARVVNPPQTAFQEREGWFKRLARALVPK